MPGACVLHASGTEACSTHTPGMQPGILTPPVDPDVRPTQPPVSSSRTSRRRGTSSRRLSSSSSSSRRGTRRILSRSASPSRRSALKPRMRTGLNSLFQVALQLEFPFQGSLTTTLLVNPNKLLPAQDKIRLLRIGYAYPTIVPVSYLAAAASTRRILTRSAMSSSRAAPRPHSALQH